MVPTVVDSGDASVTITLTSTGAVDTVTFADISAALPAAAANYRIKAFLDAARGSAAATLAALAAAGSSISTYGLVTSAPPFVSADKTLAGLAAGAYAIRISLSYTASK
jgi:hypothetical protein